MIFPNPSEGLFNIDFNGQLVNSAMIRVYDLSGRMVYETILINGANVLIDISNKAKGTYFLEVQVGETLNKKRIVKNR